MERYLKNYSSLNEAENNILHESRVCVVGCGGLGGYVIETLGRIGVGSITAVDGDVFVESNLNRQLLSDTENIGQSKAQCAYLRMKKVNPEIKLNPIREFLREENAAEILAGHDVIVDALDNIESRKILQNACEELNIPFVHGAIAGWIGEIATVYPGDKTLDIIYKGKRNHGIENIHGNLPFTASTTASIQASEVVKILVNKGETIRNSILFIDLKNLEFNLVNLK